MINKILFITLSNIGDVILTLPSLDALKESFPGAKITCLVGKRPKEIFENNPFIDRLIIFNKHAGLKEKARLWQKLRNEKFDMVIDLRNSFFGFLVPAKYKISHVVAVPKSITHMKDRHLYKINDLLARMGVEAPHEKSVSSLFINPLDKDYIEDILRKNNIAIRDRVVVVSVGARSHIKRWPKEKFSELVSGLIKEFSARVILVGDKDDQPIAEYVARHSGYRALNLTAKTSIGQLAYLLKYAALLITNDSASLHLASYINLPVLAIFGPTNEKKYGPWSDRSLLAKKDIFCRPCEKAQCKFNTLSCTAMVKVEDVLQIIRKIFSPLFSLGSLRNISVRPIDKNYDFKRILIVRTDRIGDVLLSTPVANALRDRYPYAYIAMMVAPYAKDIVEGNPYLDQVIIYDKDGKHKSWARSMKFARNLKKKKFDLAIILHPTNRVHLITFFAGIKRRVGYDRKLGFLLTDRLKHAKQFGEKHELEYNLDLLRHLGLKPQDKDLFMPIRQESEDWADALLREEGIKYTDKILAIHPGASCPSKVWPQEKFAEVADKLVEKYGFKVLLVSGPKDISLAQGVIKHMSHEAINLAGKTSVSQLASLLKRAQLFISNDSGPVHIASAVGAPVISIFGRSQKGLGPARWGPVGKKDRIAKREVGCVECLAHNCIKKFACLEAVTSDYVVSLADSILK